MSATYLRFEPDPAGEVIRLSANSGLGHPLTGTGSPEGLQTGTFLGEEYVDTSNGALYVFIGTPGTTTGWV